MQKDYWQGRLPKILFIIHGPFSSAGDSDIFVKYFRNKGWTVVRPLFVGRHPRSSDAFDIEEALMEARAQIKQSRTAGDEVYFIGFGFGANMAISLSLRQMLKMRGLALVEMPIKFSVAFNLMYFLSRFTHATRKAELYKKFKFDPAVNQMLFSPFFGKIKKYIREHTPTELKLVKNKVLVVQAVENKILHQNNANIILNTLAHPNKDVYYVPIKNCDFNLLDNAGRIKVSQAIYNFFK